MVDILTHTAPGPNDLMGETFMQTMNLRWYQSELQQMWQGSNGTQEWKPIPSLIVDDQTGKNIKEQKP